MPKRIGHHSLCEVCIGNACRRREIDIGATLPQKVEFYDFSIGQSRSVRCGRMKRSQVLREAYVSGHMDFQPRKRSLRFREISREFQAI